MKGQEMEQFPPIHTFELIMQISHKKDHGKKRPSRKESDAADPPRCLSRKRAALSCQGAVPWHRREPRVLFALG